MTTINFEKHKDMARIKHLDKKFMEEIELLEHGSFEDIKKYIMPYLSDFTSIPSDYSDVLKELRASDDAANEIDDYFLDEDETQISSKWNGFNLLWQIDWKTHFSTFPDFDNITESMLEKWKISKNTLHETALKNLEKHIRKDVDIHAIDVIEMGDGRNIGLYAITCNSKYLVPYVPSIMLLNNYMEYIHLVLQDEFYLYPYGTNCIFVSKCKETDMAATPRQVLDYIKGTEYKPNYVFSERILSFTNGKITPVIEV